MPSNATASWACAAATAWLALGAPAAGARAQDAVAAALNTYRPPPHPSDGFMLAGARTSPHLSLAAQFHLDYANDPLVYEDVAGSTESELVALVSDQMTGHLALSLGLYDLAMVFVGWPLHVLMEGSALGNQPTATGFGSGDLQLGGRLALHHSRIAAVALQIAISAPTGEGGAGERPGVAGDAGPTFEPLFAGEIAAGPLRVLLNVGARWRRDAQFAGTRFTDVLVFGAGTALPLLANALRLQLELQGVSPLDDLGERAGSPLQALLGAKLHLRPHWTFGLAGGAGLLRGYGSPDARAVLMVGYSAELGGAERVSEPGEEASAEPETALQPQAPAPTRGAAVDASGGGQLAVADRDKDGVPDLEDRCPIMPSASAGDGCPEFIRHEPHSGAVELLQPIRFQGESAELLARSHEALEEVAAMLVVSPQMKLRIEAHAASGRRAEVAQARSVERALAVARWLIARGIAARQLEALGCGQNRPVVNARGAQRAKNERIELYVIDPLPPSGMRSTLGCAEAELPKPAPTALTTPDLPQVAPARPVVQPPAPAPKPAAAAPATPPAPVAKPAAPLALPLPAPQPAAPPPAAAPAPKPAATPPAAPAPKPAAVAPVAPRPGAAAAPVAATTASVAALLAREPEGDADRDGVANQKDDCPLAPGPSGAACPEGHRVDLENGRIELLKPIRFEEGSDALDARGEKQLDEIAATLRANARMKILVESHVAAESAPQPGLALSTKRASAARKALLARGIAPERIKAYGCGENRPIAPNNVPWGRKKNERLEVHLLDPAPTTGVHSTEGCSASE